MNYFAGGESNVDAALKELNDLKQGKMRMVQFGQVLREVARKAEVYSDRKLISYLKTAVNPEMKRAIIYRGPTTYSAAVDICIEVETDLAETQMDTSTKTLNPTYAPVGEASNMKEKQNFQHSNQRGGYSRGFKNNARKDEKRTCFRCKRPGHLKKDCKVKLPGSHQQNYQAVVKDDEDDQISDDSDLDVFNHFFSNNQDLVKNNDMNAYSGNRFKMMIKCGDQDQEVLVDTGSTTNTISEEAARRLNL
ncbi:hypothetical protein BD770DRAFT_349687, partial [Pilaira anomala]